tara:strand:- start:6843 stop:8099 length:1257 start_codon:yes stop_codon:yes gene_type:complete
MLIALAILSYFVGFYLDENSAGAGGYEGDFDDIWNNLQIFLKNDLINSIGHPEYDDSRTPIAYILHESLNPFAKEETSYRRSVFAVSLLLPILFYLCLKQKFEDKENLLLILLASIIFLSPYFRTSAYWGLEENYGLICLLLTFLSEKFFSKQNNKSKYKEYLNIFFITFLSSLCLYFDQKLVIIPIIYFFKIVLSEKFLKYKIFLILCYTIFAIPYIFLIKFWGALIPAGAADIRGLGTLFPSHPGFAVTIIAFYLFPLFLFKNEKIPSLIKSFFLSKKNYFFTIFFLLYLIFLVSFVDLDQSINGNGIVNKISLILFDDIYFRSIFIYFSFFIAWILILIYFGKNLKDLFIIGYFLILSIILYPIFQEYFDPLIFIMAMLFFSTKININYTNTIIIFFYFMIFLISANIYYINLLS